MKNSFFGFRLVLAAAFVLGGSAPTFAQSYPQKGIKITQKTLKGANHFFTEHTEELIEECALYLDKRLGLIEGGRKETMLLR